MTLVGKTCMLSTAVRRWIWKSNLLEFDREVHLLLFTFTHACGDRPLGWSTCVPTLERKRKLRNGIFPLLILMRTLFLPPFFSQHDWHPKLRKEKKVPKKRKVLFSLLFEVSCSLWEFERLLIDFSPSLQPGSLPFPPSFGFARKKWNMASLGERRGSGCGGLS